MILTEMFCMPVDNEMYRAKVGSIMLHNQQIINVIADFHYFLSCQDLTTGPLPGHNIYSTPEYILHPMDMPTTIRKNYNPVTNSNDSRSVDYETHVSPNLGTATITATTLVSTTPALTTPALTTPSTMTPATMRDNACSRHSCSDDSRLDFCLKDIRTNDYSHIGYYSSIDDEFHTDDD